MNAGTPEQSGPERGPTLVAALGRATAELRNVAEQRWVEISDRMLATALTVTRHSMPVRAEAASGPVHVSEQVITTHLRAALGEVVGPHRVDRLDIALTGADLYDGVTVQFLAVYDEPLLPVADEVRRVALEVLTELLGPVTPAVTVRTMHVHFSDVVKL